MSSLVLTFQSIIGEAVGAIITFILYKKGLKKWRIKETQQGLIRKIKKLEGKNTFWMILILRIMPFIPSGVVTIGAAFSKVSLSLFAVASTIGKIPSLLIEAATIYGFMQVDFKIQIIIVIILLCFLIWKMKFR
ncbi:TVP38/TMEM64 family protein [Ureibacillus chungkukjangi]|uniref:TVP38/TMEM64 family protein n=1 Tax=Ureibacillus chungkukjangi TaxID=1202712 RepID=UPI002040A548|nr:VTT domain-containing protein [Ureibacillus chungkukjangi]